MITLSMLTLLLFHIGKLILLFYFLFTFSTLLAERKIVMNGEIFFLGSELMNV